jgi:hypothetical protein
MDALQKISNAFEIHSVEGIRDCIENGINPNETIKDNPLIYDLINMYFRSPALKTAFKYLWIMDWILRIKSY